MRIEIIDESGIVRASYRDKTWHGSTSMIPEAIEILHHVMHRPARALQAVLDRVKFINGHIEIKK